MPIHTENRFLPYTPEQLFELVAAIDRYPEFLPWCVAARIRSRDTLPGSRTKTLIAADLMIGYRMIRERYTSRVTLDRPRRVDIACDEGQFRYLNSHWILEPVAPSHEHGTGGTLLTFYIEFEFRSNLLQPLIGAVFDEAATRMVAAFEDRARQ